jgi:hypothetical protein
MSDKEVTAKVGEKERLKAQELLEEKEADSRMRKYPGAFGKCPGDSFMFLGCVSVVFFYSRSH